MGNSIEQWLEQAEQAHDAGALEEALQGYDAVLAAQPEHAVARSNRAQILLVWGEYRQALIEFHQVIDLEPNVAVLYLNRGYAHQRLGEQAAAQADYEAALRLDPDLTEAKGYLAMLMAEKAPQEAMSRLHRVLEEMPDFYEAWLARADLYFARADWLLAVADLVMAQDINPERADTYQRLEQIGEKLSARIAAQPEDTQRWVQRARYYAQQGLDREAIQDWDQAIRLAPRNALLRTGRGRMWLRCGDPARAIIDFDRAIALQPEQAEFYKERGIARAEAFQPVQARQDFDQALRLDPEQAEYRFLRGRLLRLMGHFHDALRDLRAVQQAAWGGGEVWEELAEAYVGIHDMLRAAGAYERATTYISDPDLALTCAWAWAELGEYQSALKQVEEALHWAPDWEEALYWRDWLLRHASLAPAVVLPRPQAATSDTVHNLLSYRKAPLPDSLHR